MGPISREIDVFLLRIGMTTPLPNEVQWKCLEVSARSSRAWPPASLKQETRVFFRGNQELEATNHFVLCKFLHPVTFKSDSYTLPSKTTLDLRGELEDGD